MRRSVWMLAPGFLLLAACGKPATLTLEQHLQNPLYAEYYYDDLVEQIVQMQIANDPSLQDEKRKEFADGERRKALTASRDAEKLQEEGKSGMFVPGAGFTQGEVLLLDGMLYFHPQFITVPSPATHVYLTDVLDPRDEKEFPDPSAVDLGSLHSPYNDQTYVANVDPEKVRTVVLWDGTMKRMIGFAQIRSPK